MDSKAKITLEFDLINMISLGSARKYNKPTKDLKEINALYKEATSRWSLSAIRNRSTEKYSLPLVSSACSYSASDGYQCVLGLLGSEAFKI